MYTIKFSDGSVGAAETYDAAKDTVLARYEDAEIGHDGDLEEHGDRTLCWADEESSVDDDGRRAIASIYRERTE